MHDVVHRSQAWLSASVQPSTCRYLLAIAGTPGSGKTSSAYVTCQLLNKVAKDSENIAAVLPMDGRAFGHRNCTSAYLCFRVRSLF